MSKNYENENSDQKKSFNDFFPAFNDFSEFWKNDTLFTEDIKTTKEETLKILYWAFSREYRHVIVLEPDFFLKDFMSVFIDNKIEFLSLRNLGEGYQKFAKQDDFKKLFGKSPRL